MNKKIYLPVIALMLWAPLLSGQSLGLRETWLMNEKLLDLVEGYERFSSFERQSDAESYVDLFVSPYAMVWCDYLSTESFGHYISAREYASLSEDMAYRSVNISNMRKHDFVFVGNAWHTRVEFDKRINYEDGMGFTFSSQSKLAGGDFHFALDCVWMSRDSVFRIEKVVGSGKAARDFPSGTFRIVKEQNGVGSELLYDGKPIEYNEYGFAILPNNGEFSINDDDCTLEQEVTPGVGRYDVYSFHTKSKIFRLRPRVSMLFNPVTTKTVYGSKVQPFSFGMEAGVDFGAAFNVVGNLKYVPYAGIGLADSWMGIRSSSLPGGGRTAYSYLGQRDYNFGASENFSFVDLAFSLSPASFEYGLGNGLSAAMEAGFKLYVNLLTKDNYKLDFTSPRDVNLKYGYLKDELPLSTAKGLPHYWIASCFVKGGLDWTSENGSLFFLHLGFENGMGSYSGAFKNVIYNNPNPTVWYDEEAGIYPVVFRRDGDTINDLKDHSFRSSIKSVRRRFSGILEFGVKFKF